MRDPGKGERRAVADIFISHAYGDEEAAGICADALRRLGFSVSCPAAIPGEGHGGRWLARELDRAACVLVLWSAHAVRCGQVLADAERALIDRKYVPLALEALPLRDHPRGLPLTAAPVLGSWTGALTDPGWTRVLKAVRRLCPYPERFRISRPM